MGANQQTHGAWNKLKEIADKIDSPHADKIYVAKDYTKKQLHDDILDAIRNIGRS